MDKFDDEQNHMFKEVSRNLTGPIQRLVGRRADFSRIFIFEKILEQTKAGLWALRCHNGRSRALLNCLCLAAIV